MHLRDRDGVGDVHFYVEVADLVGNGSQVEEHRFLEVRLLGDLGFAEKGLQQRMQNK